MGAGAEQELENGEFVIGGSLPPVRGRTGASQGPLQSLGWKKTQEQEKRSDFSLPQAPNWKMFKPSPLPEGDEI